MSWCAGLFLLVALLHGVCTWRFLLIWRRQVAGHWRAWGSPGFWVLYLMQLSRFWPLVVGRACEACDCEALLRQRNRLRVCLLLMALLILPLVLQAKGPPIDLTPPFIRVRLPPIRF